MAESKSSGTVKWFSGQKGFGFIAPADGEDDIFVHQSEIQTEGFRTLHEGQIVKFSISVGEDGSRAKAVDVTIQDSDGGGRGRRGGRGRGRRGQILAGGRGRGRVITGGDDDGDHDHEEYHIGGGGSSSTRACYNCGRSGHFARDCYQQGRGKGGRGSERDTVGRGGERGGRGYSNNGGGGNVIRGGRRGGGRECYNCGDEGHFARDCKINNQAS